MRTHASRSRPVLQELEDRTTPALVFAPFPNSPIPQGEFVVSTVAGDFNGDGITDLAVNSYGYSNESSSYTYSVRILLGNGDGTFTDTGSILEGEELGQLVVADFDGDGNQDLLIVEYVCGCDPGTGYIVLLGNGDGTFTPAPTTTAPASYYGIDHIVAADFDGDGIVDLAYTSFFYDVATYGIGEAVILLLGNGDGTFREGPFQFVDDAYNLIAADFNGDGSPDLAVSSPGIGEVTILLNNGDGTFDIGSVLANDGTLFPFGLAAGDFDGDGITDLAVANFYFGEVAIFLGNGDGTFADPNIIEVLQFVPYVTTADFNGDGILDLAISATSEDSIDCGCGDEVGSILILTGNGDGTFAPLSQAAVIPAPIFVNQFVLADFDRDGRIDLAFSSDQDLFGPFSGSVFVTQNQTPFSADLAVSITGPLNPAVGATVTYTVTIINNGPQVANFSTLTIPLPPGLSNITFTSVANGGATGNTPASSGPINDTLDLPIGSTVVYSVTGTFVGPTVTVTATATTASGVIDPVPSNNTASLVAPAPTTALFAVGAGVGGGPHVIVFNPDGSQRFSFFAFDPAFTGGVRVATGDLNGDGIDDIIVAAGPGGGPIVSIFDGSTGAFIMSFFAYDPSFTGGVYVAADNGVIVTGAGAGGGPHVRIFAFADGMVTETASFFAYNPLFTGGVTVAVANGVLATGAGPGGGPHVVLYDLASLEVTASFFAFPPNFLGGVNVALGGGFLAIGPGPQVLSAPQVLIFSLDPLALTGAPLAFALPFAGGVNVGLAETDQGLQVKAAPASQGSLLTSFTTDGEALGGQVVFDPIFLGGVFVG